MTREGFQHILRSEEKKNGEYTGRQERREVENELTGVNPNRAVRTDDHGVGGLRVVAARAWGSSDGR